MKKFLQLLALTFILLLPGMSLAVNEPADSDITWKEQDSPGTFNIGEDLAIIKLDAGFKFIDKENCAKFMESLPEIPDDSDLAIIRFENATSNGYVNFSYDKVGYILDDTSSIRDEKLLLDEIIKSNEKFNEERIKKNIPPLYIVDWDEKPHYEKNLNTLVWSYLCQTDKDTNDRFINYDFRILGRFGYMNVKLVCSVEEKEWAKTMLNKIINGFEYRPGKKYSDYNKSQDKVSNLKLGSLITGKNNFRQDWNEKRGPGQFSLGPNIASITIDDGYSFIESSKCDIFKDSIGDIPTQREIGIVVPFEENNENWFIEFNNDPVGYVVEDTDSIEDDGKLLDEIKAENEKAEKLRKSSNLAGIKIIDWDEKVKYDKVKKVLTWSLVIESSGKKMVSFNARFLSYDGYTSTTLVADYAGKDKLKPVFNKVVQSFSYNESYNYDNIEPLKNKISAYNLSGVITGKESGQSPFLRKFILIAKVYGLVILGIIAVVDILRRIIKQFLKRRVV
ncbi:DUF2167 domain-containing protein [Pseudobacteroides cellulosolvens]|uniref:Uncharacterized protein n=1 Tax=Pseudobacteroides cellulosolvens ATCC 35603 = DSM 2933 TaxID=398512 RepID=A0A0L6JVG1_9FIRM|nr:DUF2167 domain-containing protein [Pseudobacteroides cellulosolvens]KNY29422.1 Protein of unknown function DUF2167, membrane [Pseudobacteroides cellulosolvens ATCC 35603 = DSM 2933]